MHALCGKEVNDGGFVRERLVELGYLALDLVYGFSEEGLCKLGGSDGLAEYTEAVCDFDGSEDGGPEGSAGFGKWTVE